MRGSMRQRSPGRWQFRVYEGSDPITGKDRYRTLAFEGSKRQAQTSLAGLVAESRRRRGRTIRQDRRRPAGGVAVPHRAPRPIALHPLRLPPPRGPAARRLQGRPPQEGHHRRPLPLPRRARQPQARHRPPLPHRSPRRLRPSCSVGLGPAQPRGPGQSPTGPPLRGVTADRRRRAAHPRAGAQLPEPGERAGVRLLAATGCRRGEVCAIQWQDIDLNTDPVRLVIRRAVIEIERQLTLQGTKTHAIRKVSLDEETSQLLREHRDRVVEFASAAGIPVQTTDSCSSVRPAPASPYPRAG